MKKIAVIAALLSSATGSMATTYDLGSLPPFPSVSSTFHVVTGSFSDRYDFTFCLLGCVPFGSATVVQNISGLVLAGEANIGAGYFLVTGTVTQLPGQPPGPGVYNLTAYQLVPPPIPEPETYALMLAGLGIVGFVAAGRRPRV